MLVFLLCLGTIVYRSIGYTFYDQSLCYALLLYNGPIECVLTSLEFPDVGSSSVWLLSIPNMEKLPSSLAMYGVTECQSFLLLFFVWFRLLDH